MSTPDLTLDQGRRPALFRQLTVEDGFVLGSATELGWAELRERYAPLIGLSTEDFMAHPKRVPYQREQPWWAIIWPAIIAAWAGPGERPTMDELRRCHRTEILACAREVLRLNAGDPDMADLSAELALLTRPPAEVAAEMTQAVADPNA